MAFFAGLPRRQMATVGLGVFAISVLSHFRTPVLPEIGAELGMSTAELGLVTTVFAFGRLLTDVPAGMMVDRIGVRRMFVAAGFALGLGGASIAGAPTSAWVLAGALVLGVASALANTTGMTYFSAVAPVERRGSSMAAFSASLLGGQAIGPMLGGAIATLGTWRTAMAVSAATGGVLALVGAFSRAEDPTRTRHGVDRSRGGGKPVVEERPLAVHHRVVLYAIPFASGFTMGSLPQTLVPIIGGSTLGLTSATIGLAIGVGGACRMLGSPTGGFLSDRVSRKGVMIPALLGQAAGVAILAFADTTPLWLASIVLMSLFSFAGSIAATMLADLVGTARIGRRLGAYRLVGDVGLITGPATTAVVYDRVGQVPAVLLVAVLLTTVAVLAATVLPETRRAWPTR